MIKRFKHAVNNPLLALNHIWRKFKYKVMPIKNKYNNYIYFDGDRHVETVSELELRFWADNYFDRSHLRRLFASNRTEKPVMEDFISELDSEDVFWDVGSHIGVYSIISSNIISSSQIFAFEPMTENIEAIRRNLELNGATEAKVVPRAISDGTGENQLQVSPQYRMGSLITNSGEEKNTIQVDIDAGDSIIENAIADPPTVVKMDIEGEELKAIKGMDEALREHIRLIYIEVHRGLTSDEQSEIECILKSSGFSVETVYEEPQSYYLKGKL